jgi:hypothetical protein
VHVHVSRVGTSVKEPAGQPLQSRSVVAEHSTFVKKP